MLLRDPIEEMREQLVKLRREMLPISKKFMETLQHQYRQTPNTSIKKKYKQLIAKQAQLIATIEKDNIDETPEK